MLRSRPSYRIRAGSAAVQLRGWRREAGPASSQTSQPTVQAASRTTCLPRANGTGTSWARMPTDPRKVKCLRGSALFLSSLRTLYYKFMRSCFKRTLRSARFSPMRQETKLGHECSAVSGNSYFPQGHPCFAGTCIRFICSCRQVQWPAVPPWRRRGRWGASR